MNIELPLEGMTWGDLRAFVAMGKDVEDAETVTFDFDDNFERQSMFITGWTPEGQ